MRAIQTLRRNAGFVLAVAGAAVVGGASTALVTAAIPSASDGRISGCYRKNASLTDAKGALRAIDSEASQSCGSQETALQWGASSSNGVVDFKAVVSVRLASQPLEEQGNLSLYRYELDPTRSKNVAKLIVPKYVGDNTFETNNLCVKFTSNVDRAAIVGALRGGGDLNQPTVATATDDLSALCGEPADMSLDVTGYLQAEPPAGGGYYQRFLVY